MTTVVYHKNIIAVDSRIIKGDIIIDDDFDKIVEEKGVIFIWAGNMPDVFDLVKAYFGESYSKKININAIVDDNGKVYSVGTSEEGYFWKVDMTDKNCCIGSGRWHAWTALDCGQDAKGAVFMAMKRDMFTGGRIRIHEVNKK